MEAITEAIRHAVTAGKLRTYVRENGPGLRGFERLADRHSRAAAAALANTAWCAPVAGGR